MQLTPLSQMYVVIGLIPWFVLSTERSRNIRVQQEDHWQTALDAVKAQFEINDLLTEQVNCFKPFFCGKLCFC